MRKLMRSVARANLRKAGITRINKSKKDSENKSFFAKHWREWVFKRIGVRNSKKKRRSA